MSPEISERAFEEAVECALLRNGPDGVHVRFLRSTSPVDWPTLPEVLETAAEIAAA